MAEALALSGLTQTLDMVLPVPLHPERLRERGYNQAALLARAVCDHVSLPLTEARLRASNTAPPSSAEPAPSA